VRPLPGRDGDPGPERPPAELGAPARAGDLVVEVVTEESADRDRVEKVAEYAACGVPEYWLVDPRPGWGTLDLLTLGWDGRYAALPPDGEGRLWSRVLPGLWVEADGWGGIRLHRRP
jgi:Uma2 family endonuclease